MSRWDKNSEDYFRNRSPKKRRQEVDTAGQTETFLTRNVRLITFLICLSVFLAFFGPWSVFRIMEYLEAKNDTRIPMTEADLITLSELDRELYYTDIKGFLSSESVLFFLSFFILCLRNQNHLILYYKKRHLSRDIYHILGMFTKISKRSQQMTLHSGQKFV